MLIIIDKNGDGSKSDNNEVSDGNKKADNYAAKVGYGTLQEAIDAISSDPSSIDVIGISNARIGDFVNPEDRIGGGLA